MAINLIALWENSEEILMKLNSHLHCAVVHMQFQYVLSGQLCFLVYIENGMCLSSQVSACVMRECWAMGVVYYTADRA